MPVCKGELVVLTDVALPPSLSYDSLGGPSIHPQTWLLVALQAILTQGSLGMNQKVELSILSMDKLN